MAVTKLTRSPRRAQLQPTPASSRIALGRLSVYENLHALNRDFEQVLADLARLQELGVFRRDRFTVFRLIVQETRAWANVEVVQVLQQREEDDWVNFGGLRDQWATKVQDAERLQEQRRKSVKKKRQR
jgi:hypothetical protein